MIRQAKLLLKQTPFYGAYVNLRILYQYKLIAAMVRGILRFGIRNRCTVGFTPDRPGHYSHIKRIMLLNRYTEPRPGEQPDVGVYWAYGAGDKPPVHDWRLTVNERCRDISKRHLDDLHREIFGYGLSVDPLTFTGPAFVKSDDNGIHDGHIEVLPVVATTPGMVYQKVIANEMPDGTRQDIRIPVVGETIPFVYLVYRKLNDTISGRVMGRTELRATHELLSPEERDKVTRLCRAAGLEFGELDALRDTESGRFFVVDVNRAVGVSVVPREMVSEREYWEQLAGLADLFDSTYVVPKLRKRQVR